MARQTVVRIIDANTFEVEPGWRHDNKKGNKVKASGYSVKKTQDKRTYESAMRRLNNLVLGKVIELRTIVGFEEDALACEIYIDGVKLSDYFPDL